MWSRGAEVVEDNALERAYSGQESPSQLSIILDRSGVVVIMLKELRHYFAFITHWKYLWNDTFYIQ